MILFSGIPNLSANTVFLDGAAAVKTNTSSLFFKFCILLPNGVKGADLAICFDISGSEKALNLSLPVNPISLIAWLVCIKVSSTSKATALGLFFPIPAKNCFDDASEAILGTCNSLPAFSFVLAFLIFLLSSFSPPK